MNFYRDSNFTEDHAWDMIIHQIPARIDATRYAMTVGALTRTTALRLISYHLGWKTRFWNFIKMQ
jgi:hypothetical protein